MIPYGSQDIIQADIDAVVEVLRSDFLTQSMAVAMFEQSVASNCGPQHAVAQNSSALALQIDALIAVLRSNLISAYFFLSNRFCYK
jgi:dTDP-4-amino-4,6-dideoxygalactose transaminase